jgi:hypothetical protein
VGGGGLRRISLREVKATSLRLESNLEKDFAAAVYLFEAPPHPGLLSWDEQTIS